MSQIKITLRPPPNVDFVQGYPGIPPASPDRPQAAVKGALEVRLAPQGVKAKWVKIMLRKVETLPAGGQGNIFYDVVGPGPVYLWKASEEYAVLQTQDLPFFIRIPEAMPPTITLEKGGGIRYELLATVCVKGKRGFFRQRKDILQSSIAAVIIDKHELHSTWPVYCQAEVRRRAQEGVTLTVNRNHSCYGPGDRVSVMATIKSDSLNTVILRGFEFTLKETTVLHPAHTAKKIAPHSRTAIIGQQKVPVNATLYGGTHHKAELACMIPATHTTPSLGTARHIDVNHSLEVKALMGTGTHLVMDIPVTVSNWPRNISAEAIRRIGPVPSLSLIPPNPNTNANSYPAGIPPPAGFIERPNEYSFDRGAASLPNVPPSISRGAVEESRPGPSIVTSPSDYSANVAQVPPAATSSYSSAALAEPLSPSPLTTVVESQIGTRRPHSAGAGRDTANINDTEVLIKKPTLGRPSTGGEARGGSASQWNNGVRPPTEDPIRQPSQSRRAPAGNVTPNTTAILGATPSSAVSPIGRGSSQNTPWPTAEEEKLRLFEEAQDAARRTQAKALRNSPPGGLTYPNLDRASSTSASGSASSPVLRTLSGTAGTSKLAGAALYSQAIDALNKQSAEQSGSSAAIRSGPHKMPIPQYPTAEEEKAALRRYHEAKQAVERGQQGDDYAGEPSSKVEQDLPPPFQSSSSAQQSWMSEKERLRLADEARAMADAREMFTPPPAFSSTASAQPSWMTEKERLKRKYMAEDAAAGLTQAPAFEPAVSSANSGMNGNPQRTDDGRNLADPFLPRISDASLTPSPPPSLSGSILPKKHESPNLPNGMQASQVSTQGPKRSVPSPPLNAGTSKPLTAAEEKALLKAKFKEEDQIAHMSNYTSPASASASAPLPPPLMPRPPMDYIRETQEEDERVSKLAGFTQRVHGSLSGTSVSGAPAPPLPPKV